MVCALFWTIKTSSLNGGAGGEPRVSIYRWRSSEWSELAEEVKKLFNREGFGPQFEGCALNLVQVIALLQIVVQGFAPLVKGGTHKPAEPFCILHRIIFFRFHADHRTVNSRLGSKDLASDLEEVADIAECLQLDSQNPIILGPRRGQEAR